MPAKKSEEGLKAVKAKKKPQSSKTVSTASKSKAAAPKSVEKKGGLNGHKNVLVKAAVSKLKEKASSDGLPRKKAAAKTASPSPAGPPTIEVSNHPKSRVKNLLVSQPKPADNDKNPYLELAKKHHCNITFRQFIRVEGLTSQEFRAQRIDILEHGAVILTSKLAVDHYFRICNEMRVTVPETMKYFCINEQTAYYLQKYIQYRKRKIFFGHGTIRDLVDVIKKNRAEKFLLPVSDVHKEQIVEILDEVKIKFTRAVFYKTVAADLTDMKSLAEFDLIVFFTPVGIKSLKQNFPSFKQANTRIAAFGHVTAQKVKELGYRLDLFAPSPQNPSMSSALDNYIKEANKK
jgi:uroporphyrinogen-III synthase